MENRRVFWLLLLLVAVLTSARAEFTPSYFLNGSNLHLRPTVTVPITSILWKHNGDLLAEWIQDRVDLTYYGDYNGRTTLDIKTGHLEIRHIDETKDSGRYTLEINNKVHGENFDILITEVPKPEVGIRPLTGDHTRAEDIKSYFLNGGELTLRPTVTVPITSILWKHNGDLLAEWIEDDVDLTYYGEYNNRTTLDIETGQLEIRNMDETKDSGSYTLEINNRVHGESYDAVRIAEVDKPIVVFRPLICGQLNSCNVSCEGKTPEAEPITYTWKKDGKVWEGEVGEKMEIFKADVVGVRTFSCRMKNPVSEKESEPEENPLFNELMQPGV